MNKRIIRVLWADDEAPFDGKYIPWDDDSRYRIELVTGVRDANDLESELTRQAKYIDAVIVDANFAVKGMPKSERTGSGLIRSIELRAKYGEGNKTIPFFLYTGRNDDVLKEMFGSGSGLLDYFIENNQKFSKLVENSTKRLFDRIFEVVTEQNSPEFQVKNQYKAEFEAAKLVPDAERLLLQGLLYEYDDNWKDVQDYFTPIRKIVERIVDECVDKEILPFVNTLEGYGKLLNCEAVNGFQLNNRIMEKTLCHQLSYLLDITQDCSHGRKNLSLGVDGYVRANQNTNLFNSVLFVAMDLLLWYEKVVCNGSLPKRDWSGNYLHKGKVATKVVTFPNGGSVTVYYSGQYQLEKRDGLFVGMEVEIIKTVSNKNKDPNLPFYVQNGCYRAF